MFTERFFGARGGRMKGNHPMLDSLLDLKGNQRACVYTEPLFGIPSNLYAPYASVYMLALGVTDRQIGIIASRSMAFQMVFVLLGGMITDKLGRKRATFIFDTISWSIPCLIWASARNFSYFAVAAIINSGWRIPSTSWTCLMVEDCDQSKLVHIFTWIYISGLVSVFFAPIAGFFVTRFKLVPTVRSLYLLAFVMMTAKFIILDKNVTETTQGRIRMEETTHESMFTMLGQYRGVFRQVLNTPKTMLTLGVMTVMNIFNMVNVAFWTALVTEKLRIPARDLGIFPAIRSLIMLFLYFTVIPRLNPSRFKRPMLTGFITFIAAELLLIISPAPGYFHIVLSIVLEAFSMAMINPMVDSLSVINVNPDERARIMSLLYAIVILISSPFGWFAGSLSQRDKTLPFYLNIILFIIGIVFIFLADTASDKNNNSASGKAPAVEAK